MSTARSIVQMQPMFLSCGREAHGQSVRLNVKMWMCAHAHLHAQKFLAYFKKS